MVDKPKVELQWLQATMPKEDWEKLNDRRLKLELKWTELLPIAVERMLDQLEAGKIQPDKLRKTKGKAQAQAGSEKKKDRKNARRASKGAAAPTEQTTADTRQGA